MTARKLKWKLTKLDDGTHRITDGIHSFMPDAIPSLLEAAESTLTLPAKIDEANDGVLSKLLTAVDQARYHKFVP